MVEYGGKKGGKSVGKLGIYYLIINLLAFFLYALDKSLAKKHRRRVSEGLLLATAVLGGALGAFLAMQLLRHKTNKSAFKVIVPLSLALHGVFLWFRLGGRIL